jgi:hypothetical protein
MSTKELTFNIHEEYIDYNYVLELCKGNEDVANDIWGLILNDEHLHGEGDMIHPSTHLEEAIREGEYIEHEEKLYKFKVEHDTDYQDYAEFDCHFITRRPFFDSPGGHLGNQLYDATDAELTESLRESDDGVYIADHLDRYFIWLPVYMYDHGGQTINTRPFSCGWDSGQLGWIVYARDRVRKDYGWSRITTKREQRVHKYLMGVVEYYDHVLQGNVWGFTHGEYSCWGFVGFPYGERAKDLYEHIASHADVPVEVVEKAFDNL